MARKLRIEYENALYHVMNRGIDRRRLFFDAPDFERMLLNLEECVTQLGVRLYAYTCLDNHFHLAVRTPNGGFSRFMQRLQTRYSVYFNLRHQRSGQVFQGPFKAILVEDGEYLLRLSRYIHLNPVLTNRWKGKSLKERQAALRQYRWSSYPEYIGRRKRKDWVDYRVLEDEVGGKFGRREGGFRKFVEAGLVNRDEESEAALAEGGLAWGSEAFVQETRDHYSELVESGTRLTEDVADRRSASRLPIQSVLAEVCRSLKIDRTDLMQRRGGAPLRGVAARMLTRYAGLAQREVARELGMSTGAAVSIRLNELRSQLSEDKAVARMGRELEKRLSRDIRRQ